MKIPKGLLKGITTFIVLGVIGYVIVIRVMPVFKKAKEEIPEMSKDKKKKKTQALPVEAGKAFIGELIMQISAQGTVIPLREIPIYAQTSGELLEVPVFESKKVKTGDLLFAIDDSEQKLNFKDAENKLLKAQVQYVLQNSDLQTTDVTSVSGNGDTGSNGSGKIETFIRKGKSEWADAERLYKNGKMSHAEYDNRKRNYMTALSLSGERRGDIIAYQSGLSDARNALERAKMKLDYTKSFASLNGVIADLQFEKGQRITSGTEFCKVLDISKVRVEAGVLEPEIGFLEPGRKAFITLSAYPGEKFEGLVETISPIVENKTCKVTILVDNPEGKIKPGMFAFVDLEAQIFKDRLLVPKEALLERQRRELIMVIRDNVAKWTYVKTGLKNKEFVEILSAEQDGLQPGQLVAVSDHYTLGHDVKVKIVNKKDLK